MAQARARYTTGYGYYIHSLCRHHGYFGDGHDGGGSEVAGDEILVEGYMTEKHKYLGNLDLGTWYLPDMVK